MLRIENDPIRLTNDFYVIRIDDQRLKVEGQRFHESRSLLLHKDDPLTLSFFDPFEKKRIVEVKEPVVMSDALYLSGPDANMERETFLEEQGRAEKLDSTKIQELLKKTFCDPPTKTIDEMIVEEVLQHKYTLEETVRLLRVHILTTSRRVEKHRASIGKKVFDGLDANYKPKPIPASRQATDKREQLINKMIEEMDMTREQAEAIVNMKMGAKK